MCQVLKITRRTYYLWIKRKKPKYEVKYDKRFAQKVKDAFLEENGLYGAPRIAIKLEKTQKKPSAAKVYRYMKMLGLSSKIRIKKSSRKPKEKKQQNRKHQNLVKRRWGVYGKNELWVTDVTMIPLLNKTWVYLSVLKDVNTGFIVGYQISMVNDTKLVMDTWKKAEKYRDESQTLIVHSDNGYQYTSIRMERYAKNHNILISLSEPGNSLDNAACETFFSQLKQECADLNRQKSFSDVVKVIDDYILYYNYSRLVIKHRVPPAFVYFDKLKNQVVKLGFKQNL